MYRVYTERKWVDSTGCSHREESCKTFWNWKDIYWHARSVCYTNKLDGETTVTAIKWFYTKCNNIWHFTSNKKWSKDGT